MSRKKATRRTADKGPQLRRQSENPVLPDLGLHVREIALRSHANDLRPSDLAMIAAALSHGGPLDEDEAVKLINQAWLLLGMAVSKLDFVKSAPPGPIRMPQPPPAKAISGAAFLRKHLPGSGNAAKERRREFYRLLLERCGVGDRFQTADQIDEQLEHFKGLSSIEAFVDLFKGIAEEIKRTPESIRKTREVRQRGGLRRTVQNLRAYLEARDGVVSLHDLRRDRKYKPGTISSLLQHFPAEFERCSLNGLEAVRIKKR